MNSGLLNGVDELFSQDEVLSYYERGRVIPLGVNHLLIMTPVHIHVPKETV